MGTTIKIRISLERDSDNTNPTAELELQPSFDGKLIFMSVTDCDRKITINSADLMLAIKSIGARS